jgi:trehalose 6-phosphate synthase
VPRKRRLRKCAVRHDFDAAELDGALLVNPNDIETTARTLNAALGMSLVDRRARWPASMEALRRHDVVRWRRDFVATLDRTTKLAA